jgi:hypothetical protein
VGRALLHLQSWVAAHKEEFTRWCNDVHHKEVLEVPGFLSCRRFEVVPGYAYAAPDGAAYLTVYQLASVHEVESDGYRKHTAQMTTAPEGVMESVSYVRTIYRERFPIDGWMAPDGSIATGDEPVGAAVLHVMMDVEPKWDAELNAWYAEEHLPSLVEVPGMLAARRFADAHWDADVDAARDAGRHQYLAVYEMRDADVVNSPEYAKACEMSPRTAALAPHITFLSQVYREVFSAPGGPPSGREAMARSVDR